RCDRACRNRGHISRALHSLGKTQTAFPSKANAARLLCPQRSAQIFRMDGNPRASIQENRRAPAASPLLEMEPGCGVRRCRQKAEGPALFAVDGGNDPGSAAAG